MNIDPTHDALPVGEPHRNGLNDSHFLQADARENNSSSAHKPQKHRRHKWAAWLLLKKLQWELRDSEKFEKECREIHCFHLAELEEANRLQITEKIRQLKTSA